MTDPFAGAKLKPVPRGKARDSFTLSAPGRASGHLFEGTVRSGKTVTSLVRWLEFVLTAPSGNLLMIGKTERSLRRNCLDMIVEWLGPRRAKLVAGDGYIKICGRKVYLAGANDEGAVARIQGLSLVGFYGDEMATWPKSIFDMARTRLSEPGAEWFGTSNPDSKLHYLNVEIIQKAKLHLRRDGRIIRRSLSDPGVQDVHVYSFTIYDNPYLTSAFVKSLERSYSGLFYKRYILGEWCMAEGAIFDMFDEARHVIPFDRIPPLHAWIGVGADHGTTAPTHAVTLGLAEYEGRWRLFVTAEQRQAVPKDTRRRTPLEQARALQGWLKTIRHPGAPETFGLDPDVLAVDSAAAGFRVTLQQLGLNAGTADKAVVAGIKDMMSLFGEDALLICEDCPELLAELPGYAWDPKAALRGQDEPIKQDDHGIDALRYIIRTTRPLWWDLVMPDTDPSDVPLDALVSAA